MVDIMDMDTVMDGGDVRRGKPKPQLKRPPKPQPKLLLILMDMDIDMDMDMDTMVDIMDMALDITVMDGGDVRRGKPKHQLKRPPKPQLKHLLIPMDMDIDMDMVMDTMVDIMDMVLDITVMDGGDVRRGKPKHQPKHLLIRSSTMAMDTDMGMDTMVDTMGMDMAMDTMAGEDKDARNNFCHKRNSLLPH